MAETINAQVGANAPYSFQGGKRPNTKPKDIVQQIEELYLKRKLHKEVEETLVPTKASLFGLDVRFRHIDMKNTQEKLRRSAFKQAAKNSGGSRHRLPFQGGLYGMYTDAADTIEQLQRVSSPIKEGGEVTFTKQTSQPKRKEDTDKSRETSRISTAPVESRRNTSIDTRKLYKYKVDTGTCYDSIAEQKLRNYVPKSVSFVTDNMLNIQKT